MIDWWTAAAPEVSVTAGAACELVPARPGLVIVEDERAQEITEGLARLAVLRGTLDEWQRDWRRARPLWQQSTRCRSAAVT